MSARSTSLNLSSDDETPRQPRRIVTPHFQTALKREVSGSDVVSPRNPADTPTNQSPLPSGRLSGSERSAVVSARPAAKEEKESSQITTSQQEAPTNTQEGNTTIQDVSAVTAASPSRSKVAYSHEKPMFKCGVSGGSALDRTAPSPIHMRKRPTHPKTLNELEEEAARKGDVIKEEESAMWAMVLKALRKGVVDIQLAESIRTKAVSSPLFKRMQEMGHHKRSDVEDRERQREEQLVADTSFHPDISLSNKRVAKEEVRNPDTYYEMQMEWQRRKEDKLNRVREEKAGVKDVELTGHPTVSPVSEAIIKALREEAKNNTDSSPGRMLHASYTEGWAERLAERDRRLKDVQARFQPSFKPQTTPYRPSEPSTNSTVVEGETRDQRLFRIAQELQMKRVVAQKTAVPVTNCTKKSPEEIEEFMTDMLKRTADSQRRKHFKIKRLQREAEKIENNGSTPKTNVNSSDLAAKHRQRTEDKEAAKQLEKATEVPAPTTNVVKTATNRTERFLIHQELTNRRKQDTLSKLSEEKADRFAEEYTFAPKITAKSRVLAASASTDADKTERGPSFLDPTEAQRWRQFHVEGCMEELVSRKAEEEQIVGMGKPRFVVGTAQGPSKHITVAGSHQAAIVYRERARRLADRHYQDMVEGRPFKDYSNAELEELEAAMQDGFLDGNIQVDENGQAFYVDNDGEAVAISAEEEQALMDELKRATPSTTPERSRKHQPRSGSPWDDKYGNGTPTKGRSPKARTAPSKVDAVGGELQEEPVDEDEMYTPKERKEKKAKKEKREKAPKEDVVAKKEQEANDLLEKWRGMAQ